VSVSSFCCVDLPAATVVDDVFFRGHRELWFVSIGRLWSLVRSGTYLVRSLVLRCVHAAVRLSLCHQPLLWSPPENPVVCPFTFPYICSLLQYYSLHRNRVNRLVCARREPGVALPVDDDD
jgi:hypothetical protein